MNCGYFWQEEGEDYPRCHYLDDGTLAPCEYDDEDEYKFEDEDCLGADDWE